MKIFMGFHFLAKSYNRKISKLFLVKTENSNSISEWSKFAKDVLTLPDKSNLNFETYLEVCKSFLDYAPWQENLEVVELFPPKERKLLESYIMKGFVNNLRKMSIRSLAMWYLDPESTTLNFAIDLAKTLTSIGMILQKERYSVFLDEYLNSMFRNNKLIRAVLLHVGGDGDNNLKKKFTNHLLRSCFSNTNYISQLIDITYVSEVSYHILI